MKPHFQSPPWAHRDQREQAEELKHLLPIFGVQTKLVTPLCLRRTWWGDMNVVHFAGVPNELFWMLENLVKGPKLGHIWLVICKRFRTGFVVVKVRHTFASWDGMRKSPAAAVPQGVCKRFGASVGHTWMRFDVVGARATVSSFGGTKLFVAAQLVEHAHGVNMNGWCFARRVLGGFHRWQNCEAPFSSKERKRYVGAMFVVQEAPAQVGPPSGFFQPRCTQYIARRVWHVHHVLDRKRSEHACGVTDNKVSITDSAADSRSVT